MLPASVLEFRGRWGYGLAVSGAAGCAVTAGWTPHGASPLGSAVYAYAQTIHGYTRELRSQLVGLVAAGAVTVPEAAARLGVVSSAAYNWVSESRKPRRPSTAQRVSGRHSCASCPALRQTVNPRPATS